MNIIHKYHGMLDKNGVDCLSAVCTPDIECKLIDVDFMDEYITCKKCLEMMADLAINTHNPETKVSNQ